jgi:hypothetical protein
MLAIVLSGAWLVACNDAKQGVKDKTKDAFDDGDKK